MIEIDKKAPYLIVNTTNGDCWNLEESQPDKFTMIIFYRGLHCPVCKGYLETLNSMVDDYNDIGVNDIIAISGDTKEKAEKTKTEWDIENLRLGYDQTVKNMKEWGLYISTAIKDEEPDEFGEPGFFLIKPDKRVYYAAYNSMPFGRPPFEDMKKAIQFVLENDYPSRGRA